MEAKEYVFAYPPKVYTRYRSVVYVESKKNELINFKIREEYQSIKSFFNGMGLKFHYLPFEIENDYSIRDLITKEEAQSLDLEEIITKANSELLNYLRDASSYNESAPCLFFCDRKWQSNRSNNVRLKAVAFGQDCYDIFDMAAYISSFFPARCMKAKSYGGSICGSMTPDDDIVSSASEICRAIKMAKSKGVSDKDIMDIVKRIIRRENKSDCIVIKKDYRIFLDEANQKEVKLAALPKALYMFFLKHPEGVNRDELVKYMPEIAYIYLKVRTRRVSNPLDTVKKMLIGNQYANNVSDIQDAFQKTYDLERNSIYSLKKDERHPQLLYIDIPADRREWQCPDILNKQIPTLPEKVSDIVRATWKILHELHDHKIDEAIGFEPPKGKGTGELEIFK